VQSNRAATLFVELFELPDRIERERDVDRRRELGAEPAVRALGRPLSDRRRAFGDKDAFNAGTGELSSDREPDHPTSDHAHIPAIGHGRSIHGDYPSQRCMVDL
jgi:hypothetical protein